MIPRPRAVAAAIAMGGALAAMAPAARALTLYDDFSSPNISPYRWHGFEVEEALAAVVDVRRTLANGQMRLEARVYGDNVLDSGSVVGINGMRVARSVDVTDLKLTITPRTMALGNCAAGGNPASAAVEVSGGFFSANSGAAAGASRFMDVRASMYLYHVASDATSAGQIYAYVLRCLDDECRSQEVIAATTLGTATLNTPVTLEMRWDKANQRFVFQRDAQAAVNLSYAGQATDLAPAHDMTKRVQVWGQPPNCTSGRVSVYTGVDIDDVYTNTLP